MRDGCMYDGVAAGMVRRKQHKLRCWVEVVEEDGGGFVCTWDGGCAYGAMEVDPIASAWKGEGGRSGKRTAEGLCMRIAK